MKLIHLKEKYRDVIRLFLLYFSFSLLVFSSSAQQTITTLEEAITFGLANNGSVVAADIEVERLKMLEKTTFDIGKTDIGMQYGQYNSFENDLAFSVNQNFQFPTVYANKNALAKTTTESGNLQKNQTENELIVEIKRTWYQLIYLKELSELLQYQNDVYVQFLKAAQVRYETEAGTLLEKVTAESKVTAVKVNMSQNNANIKIYKKRFQILLNSPILVELPASIVKKKKLDLPLDTNLIASNPNLALLTNKVKEKEREQLLEKSKILPEFSIGYFNQSLIGSPTEEIGTTLAISSNRFTGIQAGISIPLWAKPNLARIKVAKLGQQKATADAAYYHSILLSEYERVVQDYFKYKTTIDYYENNALPQAELILSNSKKSFENGAIDYVTYILSLNSGIDIKSNYLDALLQYNKSVIAIEYLAGKR